VFFRFKLWVSKHELDRGLFSDLFCLDLTLKGMGGMGMEFCVVLGGEMEKTANTLKSLKFKGVCGFPFNLVGCMSCCSCIHRFRLLKRHLRNSCQNVI